MHGPHHAKTWILAYADSESRDQPAHPCSDQDLYCLLTESLNTTKYKCPDDTFRMRRMI